MVFRGMLEARDVEEKRGAARAGENRRIRRSLAGRVEAIMVQAVGDDRDPLLRHLETAHDVVRRRTADRDDLALPPREPPRDHAAVEHPRGIVFPREVEGREIVDRRHERARPSPEHAPVARHVQHLDARATQATGQLALVPEDVFHRRAVALGHRLEAHRVPGELEERHVLLEHVERELMAFRLGQQSAHEGEHVLTHARAPALHDGRGQRDLHGVARRAGLGGVPSVMMNWSASPHHASFPRTTGLGRKSTRFRERFARRFCQQERNASPVLSITRTSARSTRQCPRCSSARCQKSAFSCKARRSNCSEARTRSP